MTTAPDIFLSCNRKDQARAKLFAAALEGEGVNPRQKAPPSRREGTRASRRSAPKPTPIDAACSKTA